MRDGIALADSLLGAYAKFFLRILLIRKVRRTLFGRQV